MHNLIVGDCSLVRTTPRLDEQLCFALYSASRAMTAAYRPILAPMGLTYPQYLVMLVLWEDGTSTVSALGRRLDLDSGTLSPLLRRLEAAGYVQRERRVGDERVVDVHLTDSGSRLERSARTVLARLARCAPLDPTLVDDVRHGATQVAHAFRSSTTPT